MNRVLVTYATRAGSTQEIAESIGGVLYVLGAKADVLHIDDVESLDAYDSIVIGSAIRMGRWLPEAVDFIDTHHDPLVVKPVALFTVCMTLSEDTEENREKVLAFMEPVMNTVDPVSVGLFGGCADPDNLSVVERIILRTAIGETGDFRNWDTIRGWIKEIFPLLVPTREPVP